MNNVPHKSALILAFCLLAFLPLNAQQSKEQLAAHYYGKGEYAQAAELYESLYHQTDNKFYYQMLLNSYLELGQTRDAERLAEQRIKKNSRDLTLYVDLAAVYLKKGDEKKAAKQYQAAIDKIGTDQQQAEALILAFEAARRQDLMLQTYLKVRETTHNKFLYVNEIAALYASMGNYEAMTQEYLDLLDNSPNSKGSVQISLQRAMQQTSDDRLSDGLRRALVDRLNQQPNNRTYIEMMIWFALQMKDFDFALAQAKAINARFPDIGGEQIYRVANIALSNADYDVAQDGFQTIIQRKEQSPYYANSRVGWFRAQFARLNRDRLPSHDELQQLREQYEEVLHELGKQPNTLPLMRDYASLLAYYLNDLQPAADILYDAIEIKRLPAKDVASVKLDLGDLMLFSGEIWEASLIYMQVERSYKNDALGAQAKLRSARLAYYTGDFTWAKSQLDVLRASTSKLVANDAMQLSLLISDNMEQDSTYAMLQYYANADLLLYRNLLDSAWTELEEIEHRSLSHPLLDEVLMQKAKIRMRQKRYDEADSLLRQLAERYPDDLLADDALILRASLNQEQLGNTASALECYEQILLNYPTSLYADEARKKYNQLKAKHGR